MRIFVYVSLLFLHCGNSSCRKVIDLKLKDSERKYVIEGMVTNEPGVCKVLITQSRNFNEDNNFTGISGAVVRISDNGVEFLLTETTAGLYETNQLTGTPGHLYQLSVTIANQTFSAQSTMPQPVEMDTLYIAPGPFGQFRFATVAYSDPAAIDNGYLFVQYLNGEKDPAIFWVDDELTSGQQVLLRLDNGVDRQDDPRAIQPGDEVMIEMQVLDAPVFRYWYMLQTGGGTGQTNIVAPADPETNIQGGALGYFSAHTVSTRTVIAP